MTAHEPDWTGAALIRATAKPRPAAPAAPPAGCCAVPGCGKRLRYDNRTGVCRHHNHHPEFSSTMNHAKNKKGRS